MCAFLLQTRTTRARTFAIAPLQRQLISRDMQISTNIPRFPDPAAIALLVESISVALFVTSFDTDSMSSSQALSRRHRFPSPLHSCYVEQAGWPSISPHA